MAELVDEGKVRWAGVANFDREQLERCEAIRHVDSVQPPLIDRRARADLLPWCRENGTGVIVYSPMASGLLTGAFSRERMERLAPDDWRRGAPRFQEPQLGRNLELVDRLRGVADRSTPCRSWRGRPALAHREDGEIVGKPRPHAEGLALRDELLLARSTIEMSGCERGERMSCRAAPARVARVTGASPRRIGLHAYRSTRIVAAWRRTGLIVIAQLGIMKV